MFHHSAPSGKPSLLSLNGSFNRPGQLSLSSSSTADSISGQGISHILVNGWTSVGKSFTEVMCLQGTTPVSTPSDYDITNINQMYAVKMGDSSASNSNIGAIGTIVLNNSDDQVVASIPKGEAKSKLGHYVVHPNKTLYITKIRVSVDGFTRDSASLEWDMYGDRILKRSSDIISDGMRTQAGNKPFSDLHPGISGRIPTKLLSGTSHTETPSVYEFEEPMEIVAGTLLSFTISDVTTSLKASLLVEGFELPMEGTVNFKQYKADSNEPYKFKDRRVRGVRTYSKY
tara:strand:- start:450 stop:1307 length:858 start_codon:yes stop_codon:yes gene_type:complete